LAAEAHRSKFPYAEQLAGSSDPYLAEEYGRAVVQDDHQGNAGEGGQQEKKPRGGT
jgi:hypothetical protein